MITKATSWNMSGAIVLQQEYYAYIISPPNSYLGTVIVTEMDNSYKVAYEYNMALDNTISRGNYLKTDAFLNLAIEKRLPENIRTLVFYLPKDKEVEDSPFNYTLGIVKEGVIVK